MQEHARHRALTLIELTVTSVCLVLLTSVAVPSLTRARDDAMVVGCAQNLNTINTALGNLQADFPGFYAPMHDDGAATVNGHFDRLATWIDVLQELDYIPSRAPGYCPADRLPDDLNRIRGQTWNFRYPVALGAGFGIDHSYGISSPYATAARTAEFPCWDPEGDPSRSVMAGDGNWCFLLNLGGRALSNGLFDDSFWGSNTVGYRHKFAANLLHRDGHVALVAHDIDPQDVIPTCNESGVDTMQHFIWRRGEPLEVGPGSALNDCDAPPAGCTTYPVPGNLIIPDQLDPSWYTQYHAWSIPDIKTYKGWTR